MNEVDINFEAYKAIIELATIMVDNLSEGEKRIDGIIRFSENDDMAHIIIGYLYGKGYHDLDNLSLDAKSIAEYWDEYGWIEL